MQNHELTGFTLPYEKLDCYSISLQLIELVAEIRKIRGLPAAAKDQLTRAAMSVSLNIAEGTGKTGKDRKRFYAIARGSALESGAALDVMIALQVMGKKDHAMGNHLCSRLYAMLTKMMH